MGYTIPTVASYIISTLICTFHCLNTESLSVLTKPYEIATRKSHKILHNKVLSHLEKSSSLLPDKKSLIAAIKATISATINKKPASTKNILNKIFLAPVPFKNERPEKYP